ncbi:ATP-binding protein [Streptomyces sp. DSM 44915]|uniref:ATP-binding protein n=1 Tax=Streptomyces chisholmiae TaxID=3075540 RepID=A0ABU2JUP4_9ACTN|nr:ATP-binding protein [Streptomyces sp. DSM 44915]MDT0268711.1 ATP-binding protein [Streptomyces sp. DSM 44915]
MSAEKGSAMVPLATAAPRRPTYPTPTARGESSFRLPAELRAAGQARRRVRVALAAWGVPTPAAEAAELVVSELVANAVRHTASGTVHCRLWDTGSRLGVEVTDEHAGPHRPRQRAAQAQDEGGRGLALVDAVSLRWGVTAAAAGPGQRVWAELPRPTARIAGAAPAGHGPVQPAETRS